MSYDVQILRAMLRLARKRQMADVDALLARTGGDAAALRDAWRRLDGQGLIERLAGERARLTMAGFAVAVSTIAIGAANATHARNARNGRRPPRRRVVRAA